MLQSLRADSIFHTTQVFWESCRNGCKKIRSGILAHWDFYTEKSIGNKISNMAFADPDLYFGAGGNVCVCVLSSYLFMKEETLQSGHVCGT